MHLSKLCPTTPSRARWRLEWGFELSKFQMPHMWGITIHPVPTGLEMGLDLGI